MHVEATPDQHRNDENDGGGNRRKGKDENKENKEEITLGDQDGAGRNQNDATEDQENEGIVNKNRTQKRSLLS
jgi:hypothetical protein